MSPGTNVSPVCVPDEDEELDEGWSCVTTGWGATKATGSLHMSASPPVMWSNSWILHTEMDQTEPP